MIDPTDTEILDWLDKEAFGIALVHDDDGNWAVSGDGWQNCRVDNNGPLEATFFIEENEFHPTARAALIAAIKEWHERDGEPWDGGEWLDRAHELGKNIPPDGELNSVDKSGDLVKCPTCGGHQTIPVVVVGTGEVRSERCPTCGGGGWIGSHAGKPCPTCGGSGRKE